MPQMPVMKLNGLKGDNLVRSSKNHQVHHPRFYIDMVSDVYVCWLWKIPACSSNFKCSAV